RIPDATRARHVPRDVRHPERRLSRLRRRLRGHACNRLRDVGCLSLAVPRGEGLRPAGALREGGATRSLLPGPPVRLAVGPAGAAERPAGRRRPLRAEEGLTLRRGPVRPDGYAGFEQYLEVTRSHVRSADLRVPESALLDQGLSSPVGRATNSLMQMPSGRLIRKAIVSASGPEAAGTMPRAGPPPPR